MLEVRPLVVADGVVVGGNMRLLVMKDLGYKEVPAIDVTEWTQAERDEFMIKDNLNYGDWDYDMLANEWVGSDLTDWGMDVWDTEPEEMQGLTDEDDVPLAPEEPTTKLGDVWILGEHRVMCGDSTSKEAVEILMDGQKADMVFTDPPYGMSYGGGRTKKFDMIKGDDENPDKFYHCIPEAREVYIWGRVENYLNLKTKPKTTIVWKKNNFGLGRGYRGQYEVCFYYGEFKGSDSNVWEISKDTNYQHPTQKPTELCSRAIKNSQPTNILDLYGGSGSTLIASQQNNIASFTMEFDPKYCDVIVKRWEDFTGKKAHLEEEDDLMVITQAN
jgi:16S rRNA G966 N2-methylase RsmD